MRLKSWTGTALASIYALIFVGAYFIYLRRDGQWFADLPLVLAATPYLWVARAITDGAYSFSGEMTGHVIAAAAACCALAYFCGWVVESAVRALLGLALARR